MSANWRLDPPRVRVAWALLGPGIVLAGLQVAWARGTLPYVQVVSAAHTPGGPGCTSFGSGLALGNHLVLTADHVLLNQADLVHTCHMTGGAAPRIEVRIGGRAARVVAQGLRTHDPSMSFANSSDYAILHVAGPTAPPLTPCAIPPVSGQPVEVSLATGLAKAAIARTQTRKGDDDADYLDLDRVFEHGTSGAGVLDAATHCVLGLISHRFPEPHPTVTRMTPVAVFLADWMRARDAYRPAP